MAEAERYPGPKSDQGTARKPVESPLEGATDLAIPLPAFAGQFPLTGGAKKSCEVRGSTMVFPRTQPHSQCGKWLGGLLHPSPPHSAAFLDGFRPFGWPASPRTELGSLVEVRGLSEVGKQREKRARSPPPPRPSAAVDLLRVNDERHDNRDETTK